MPLLYGEGHNAFFRLQCEMARSSNDESLFAWDSPRSFYRDSSEYVVLARSCLSFCWHLSHKVFESNRYILSMVCRAPYTIANQGLEFHVSKSLSRRKGFLLPLKSYCYDKYGHLTQAHAIALIKYTTIDEQSWERNFDSTLGTLCEPWSTQLPPLTELTAPPGRYGLFLVPAQWVWSHENLVREGSKTIYLRMKINPTDGTL
jgi:hypothetical protein